MISKPQRPWNVIYMHDVLRDLHDVLPISEY